MSVPEMQPKRFSFRQRLDAYTFFLGIMWRANRGLALFRFLFLLLGAALQPLEIYAFALFITAITQQDHSRAMVLLAIVIGSYGLRRLVTDITYSKIDDWFSRATSLAAQQIILNHVAKLNPEQLLTDEVRRDMDAVREDLWRLNNLPSNTEYLIRSILKLIAAFGLAFTAPWWVSAVIVLDALLQSINFWYEGRTDLWVSAWNSLEGRYIEYARYVFLSGEEFRELRLLDATGVFLRKIAAAGARILVWYRKAAWQSAMWRTALVIVHVGAYALVIIVLGRRALANAEALALLYVAANLFSLLGESLNGISSALSRISSDLGILSRIYHLFHLPVEAYEGRALPREPLVIEFKDVGYRYVGATQPALEHVTVTMREQEHIAIVGENGAGKSTFLRLLSGLDMPTSGTILINGIPLARYKPSEWRQAFHLMLQGAKLYQDFTRDNLLLGAQTKKRSRAAFALDEAVRISGADSVIAELPKGYETFLGDWVAPPGIDPYRVSGGQQQRLLIARSLIHGGRIICFDEPTSAMDALAETAFFNRLHEAMVGRGLIYISHRFSTVRRASRILVFHGGKLVEDGSHEELIKQRGKYAELYEEQAQWYAS